jgi:peptidyl-tRNA hydrolase
MRSVTKTHKMIFVANMSLKMGVGKLAAQVGHATLGVYQNAMKSKKVRSRFRRFFSYRIIFQGQLGIKTWEYHGAIKVVVKGQDADQLMALQKQARELVCSFEFNEFKSIF